MEVFVLFILIASVYVLIKAKKREKERLRKLRSAAIAEVDNMSGIMFEEYLKALLKSRGYKVRMTLSSGDFGADLILDDNLNTIVVQSKRYAKKVGVGAVQEVVSAKSYYQADECWVITNNYFTKPAQKLAKVNNATLVDRYQLIDWIHEEENNTKKQLN
ncbi:restriction system protein [Halobacillus dabanensis]|uniref:Restriction system protein n=1 Tax=Halobacillus dabanensis TaxID=240302 RepID=A0A1I3R995_HALDA|nr:restriction endonuclease [Halobacillus dabanensis]SFJ43204.1 restriction system protein [Halobacillus dabanensis]